MAADDKIIIEFDGDISALKAKLKDSKQQVSKLSKAAKSLEQNLNKGVQNAAKVTGIAFGALAAGITGALNEARKFEEITTQFKVLTGSAQEATDIVKDLQQFSATTPFQFEGISKAAQQLIGFGFETEQIVPKLQQIGDVAAAIGKPIDEVGFIFGQVAAAGKLTGERLLQFQERAIPIGPAIAKSLGVAESSVKKMVSEGKVDFKTFEEAFASLSQEGGFAFEGMIQQSKTLSGLISTLKDNFSLMAADIGSAVLPVAKVLATEMLSLIQDFNSADKGLETFTDSLQFLATLVIKAKEQFQLFGTVLGGTFATAIESAMAAINLNFAEAADIAKQGAIQVGEDIVAIEEETQKKLQELDDKFYQARQEADKAKREKAKEDAQADAEAKAQAKIDEAALLNEVEAELAEQTFQTEAARQERLTQLVQEHLKKQFDAKRAVQQDDIKQSIKENQLRMKEEVKYGKDLAAARAFFRTKEVEGTKMLLDNLATLGKSGNKTLGEIAKVAAVSRAIMNTAEGVTKALSYGPFLGPLLAGSIAAAGAVQIATIKSQGFAAGGLAEGGVPGRDSIPSLLQRGEVVAPRQNFEEVIGSVRAQREASRIADETGMSGGTTEVMLSFKDNVGEFIEATILERRQLGVGAV